MMQCLGSIDGCHIPLLSITQIIITEKDGILSPYKQLWPRSVHDSRVLKNSGIYALLRNDRNLDAHSVNIHGVRILHFLIGNSAYPLEPVLLKPFTNSPSLS